MRTIWAVGIASALSAAGGAAYVVYDRGSDVVALAPPAMSYAELTGSSFAPPAGDPLRSPEVRQLKLPPIPHASSVWGATGRDARGRIWVGVSSWSGEVGAHLLQYDPDTDEWYDRGAVLEQLRAAGVYRAGESQTKIHSKIVPAEDGWLYFASTDEEGEVEGSVPPRWGAHLWRIHPDSYQWQHLAAVPEGLVAVSGVGRYIYALGYWNHVLYQLDTATRDLKRVVVGSADGHVSRNFLADARGHAYVPRVQARAGGAATAALVEYDSELREVAVTPLEHYLGKGSPSSNHGIVGLAYLPDGRLLFTTHLGHLYVVEPKGAQPAKVAAAGWFHPSGQSYAPSLFPLGGNRLVAGVASRDSQFEWVVFELTTGVPRRPSRSTPRGCRKCCSTARSAATTPGASMSAGGRGTTPGHSGHWYFSSARRSVRPALRSRPSADSGGRHAGRYRHISDSRAHGLAIPKRRQARLVGHSRIRLGRGSRWSCRAVVN